MKSYGIAGERFGYTNGRFHTKVRQVIKCVRFSKERGNGTYPTMLHALLRKTRRGSPHKNRQMSFTLFLCVVGLGAPTDISISHRIGLRHAFGRFG